MPIYSYRCASCGFEQDVLQKISDTPLSRCPQCGAETFAKRLTAAGFQLKGSGWYVTDFRNGSGGKKPATETAKKEEGSVPAGDGKPPADSSGAAKSAAPPKNEGGTSGGDSSPSATS